MDRREILKMVLAGTASPTLLPWLFYSRSQEPRITDTESVLHEGRTINVATPRKCPVCKKDNYLFANATLIETTAANYRGNDRTYDMAGMMYFHSDGIRCFSEIIEYKKLRNPILHKRISPSVYDKKVL